MAEDPPPQPRTRDDAGDKTPAQAVDEAVEDTPIPVSTKKAAELKISGSVDASSSSTSLSIGTGHNHSKDGLSSGLDSPFSPDSNPSCYQDRENSSGAPSDEDSQRSIPTSSPRTSVSRGTKGNGSSGTPGGRRIPKQASRSVSGQVAAQLSQFDSNQEVGDTCEVMNRPRTGRSTAARDSNRDPGESELETVKALVREGLLEAKKHNDKARELGLQIVTLEEEIKSKGSKPTSGELDRLDNLYRENLKATEAEKAVLHEEPHDLSNRLAILTALSTSSIKEEAQHRNGAPPKSRKFQRQGADSDAVADSPGPSPSESRKDGLKRVKGATQRSSSVPSSGARAGAGGKSDDDGALNKGVRAEKEGQFVVGAEVFYRHQKGALNVEGEGIQCIIKKVWLDKKPIAYDVQDPEPDDAGRQDLHKAVATDLIPIPKSGSHLPTFGVGKHVLARYPDTTTFYPAEVMSFRKDTYNLKFEGEEDDKEMEVDKRFVLDLRVK